MPETRTLPHDPYIDAIETALTEARLTPEQADAFVEDGGDVAYLRGVITLTPETSGVDADRWPHGLILIWEWHTGIEAADGEPERGPYWEWAKKTISPGWSEPSQPLTAEGYASPEYVVESVRALFDHRNQAVPAARWVRAGELDAACAAWGAEEASE